MKDCQNYVKSKRRDRGETKNETVESTLRVEGTPLTAKPVKVRKRRRGRNSMATKFYCFPSRKIQVENFPAEAPLSTGHTVTLNQFIVSTDIFIAQLT
jgi:hypothetical protein